MSENQFRATTMNLDDGLDRFVLQLRADGRSPHTIAQYRRHVRLLSAWARDVGLSGLVAKLTHEDLARFLASDTAQRSAHGGGQKRATSANALRSSIRTFFRYAHEAGYTTENPARMVRRARCGEAPPRALADDDRDRLLAVLDEAEDPGRVRDRMLVRLLLGTGLRIGAAIGLDVEDFDFDRSELLVRRSKGNRSETVPMPTSLAQELAIYLCDRESGPLFPGRSGRRISVRHAQRRFRGWQERAGGRRVVGPHGCRHAFAIGLYRKTADLLLVQKALRHRSVTSTTAYARLDDDRLRRVLEG